MNINLSEALRQRMSIIQELYWLQAEHVRGRVPRLICYSVPLSDSASHQVMSGKACGSGDLHGSTFLFIADRSFDIYCEAFPLICQSLLALSGLEVL